MDGLPHSPVNLLNGGCFIVPICGTFIRTDIDTAGQAANGVLAIKPTFAVGVFGGLFQNGKGGGLHKVYTVGKGCFHKVNKGDGGVLVRRDGH